MIASSRGGAPAGGGEVRGEEPVLVRARERGGARDAAGGHRGAAPPAAPGVRLLLLRLRPQHQAALRGGRPRGQPGLPVRLHQTGAPALERRLRKAPCSLRTCGPTLPCSTRARGLPALPCGCALRPAGPHRCPQRSASDYCYACGSACRWCLHCHDGHLALPAPRTRRSGRPQGAAPEIR